MENITYSDITMVSVICIIIVIHIVYHFFSSKNRVKYIEDLVEKIFENDKFIDVINILILKFDADENVARYNNLEEYKNAILNDLKKEMLNFIFTKYKLNADTLKYLNGNTIDNLIKSLFDKYELEEILLSDKFLDENKSVDYEEDEIEYQIEKPVKNKEEEPDEEDITNGLNDFYRED